MTTGNTRKWGITRRTLLAGSAALPLCGIVTRRASAAEFNYKLATGQDPTMDPDEVALLWGSLNGGKANWDWQRASGWYGPPVPVPEEADLQDRVLGLLGRDPRWRPST